MLKFWLISDTHGQHESLIVPQGIDGIIHSGDGGTYKNPHKCKEDITPKKQTVQKSPSSKNRQNPYKH